MTSYDVRFRCGVFVGIYVVFGMMSHGMMVMLVGYGGIVCYGMLWYDML